jgi:hypothetical protein
MLGAAEDRRLYPIVHRWVRICLSIRLSEVGREKKTQAKQGKTAPSEYLDPSIFECKSFSNLCTGKRLNFFYFSAAEKYLRSPFSHRAPFSSFPLRFMRNEQSCPPLPRTSAYRRLSEAFTVFRLFSLQLCASLFWKCVVAG